MEDQGLTQKYHRSMIQSCIFLLFMHVFHTAIFVSPFMSMAEFYINAQANFAVWLLKYGDFL